MNFQFCPTRLDDVRFRLVQVWVETQALYFASAEAKALDAMNAPTPVSIALAPKVFDLPIARGATLKSIARIPTLK